ncbi:MAG: chorismate-binding protein [Saprospiraceae bacterium]|nr:chorismate-binding protein [Saprospiraceae bacterium]
MSQLIESIKVSGNRLHNLSYHQRRMQRSCLELFGTADHTVSFNDLQKEALKLNNKTLYKLQITYDKISFEFKFLPYKLRSIKSIRVVEDADVDYSHKFYNREKLNELFNKKGKADDILITRNGALTDTYYCNVALKKNGQWFTPDLPLLSGTKRQRLLDELVISPKEIFFEDIPDYNSITLFNAMIDLGDIVIPIENILLD